MGVLGGRGVVARAGGGKGGPGVYSKSIAGLAHGRDARGSCHRTLTPEAFNFLAAVILVLWVLNSSLFYSYQALHLGLPEIRLGMVMLSHIAKSQISPGVPPPILSCRAYVSLVCWGVRVLPRLGRAAAYPPLLAPSLRSLRPRPPPLFHSCDCI